MTTSGGGDPGGERDPRAEAADRKMREFAALADKASAVGAELMQLLAQLKDMTQGSAGARA